MSEVKSKVPEVRVGGWILPLAMLAALVLGLAGSSPAQSQSAGAKPAPAKPSAPRGASEGIKVHGHWTIEVRNPGGAVDKHVEFENSLQGSDGSNLLTGLISGNFTVGAWYIQLQGPCSTLHGTCVIVPPSTPIAASYNCSTSLTAASPQPFCYDTLTQSLTGASGASSGQVTTFTLSGQAYADTTTAITGVQTLASYCGGNSGSPYPFSTIAPNTCFTNANSNTNSQAFTLATLAAAPNCGGASQSPCQVAVTAGQTIQATVVLSFQ